MSIEQNKTIALRWHEEVFNQRRFDKIDELLDPDYVHHDAGIRGAAAAKAMFTEMIETTPDTHIITEDMIGEGDKVVMRWTQYNGEQAVYRGITILRIVNGKIVEDRFCGRDLTQPDL